MTHEIDYNSQQDRDNLPLLLNKLEDFSYRAVVFITPNLAEQNKEVVKEIINKGHNIGVFGEIDLSQMSLDEQVEYLSQAFYTVRNIANVSERVIDFKPYNYKFNNDTFKALKAVHARSISGVFEYNESYCKCWYAKSVGKITFPYPVEMDMIAVPISEFNGRLLDASNGNIFEDAKLKLQLQEASPDPIVLSLEPSKTELDKFEKFLGYVNSSGAKVTGLPNPEPWITNLKLTGPSEANVSENVTLSVTYTSTKYCPHYRFHVYGRYPGEEWRMLDSWEHCYYVYTGYHSFNRQITIPQPPQGENNYTVRVVGRASFGTCDRTDPDWPIYNNFEAMDEIKINVTDYKLKLLFVPLNWTGTQATFDAEVDAQANFFLNDIPLGACRDKVNITKLNVATQNFAGFTCTYPNDCGVQRIKPFVRGLGIGPEDYDIIVGVVENSPCPPIAGCSNLVDTVWVTSTYDSVTAHEIGHIFGLSDEYCSNQAGSVDCRCNDGCVQGTCPTKDVNPLNASMPYDCPPDGSIDSNGI